MCYASLGQRVTYHAALIPVVDNSHDLLAKFCYSLLFVILGVSSPVLKSVVSK